MDTATVLRALDPLSFYDHYRLQNIRPDGRSINQIREARIHTRVLSNEISDGSSSVSLGSTSIVASATCVPLSPDNDNSTNDLASISVSVMLPERRSGRVLFSSSSSRSGSLALRLEHALNLCLKRSSLSVQYKLLGREGEKKSASGKSGFNNLDDHPNLDNSSVVKDGWRIMLELVCTSYDGNVTDAAFLAASSALKCTSYPVMHYQTGVEESCNGHRFLAKSLSKGPEFLYFPISISFVRIKGGSEFVCDPSSSNAEDETVSSLVYGSAIPLGTTALSTATMSVEVAVSVNDESKDVLNGTILHVALSGYPSIEQKEIERACNEAKKLAQAVGKLL